MNDSDVNALLQNGQNTQVAFASEKSTDASLVETLGALANASGGTVLLGVTRAGSLRGVRDADALCERVLWAALSTTPPLVLPVPERLSVGERMLVAVHVPRGLPNVYAMDGRYVVRDGPCNRPLQATEIHQLMLRRGAIPFETQSPPGATLNDLDQERIGQYANRLDQLGQIGPEDLLRRRACLIEAEGHPRPTSAGLLLFGHHPSLWIPGAEITAVRYSGSEMGDEFVRQDIQGPLPDQIRKAEAFLHANVPRQTILEGLTHIERPTFPDQVLREVVVNAVAHRDYRIEGESIQIFVFSDRIRVYSPGKLPGHVTVENIVRERFSRNPVIVQVLADMGFIERLGYGIDRMLRLLREAGQPAPSFVETTAGFQVTLVDQSSPAQGPIQITGHARWSHLDLNPRQELAVQYVIEHQRITNREYQRLCPDVSAETIRRDLSDLVHQDVLLRIGRKRATYYILKDADLASS
jgi:ATP-dependent DNA helicase RecG